VYGWANGTKWAYFENLSTTTKIQLNLENFEIPSIKSMEMSLQACVGVGRGANNPGYFTLLGLACCHTPQVSQIP
jgi:hypothetical protein